MEEICSTIKIQNVNNIDVPKYITSEAINKHHAEEAIEEMGKKLKEMRNEDIGRPREYMQTKCISDCRLKFRIRTNMVELKANMKGSYKDGDFSCLGCGNKSTIDYQSHVMRCPAFSELREGLDFEKDEDLVKYFREVMMRRMKMK